MTTKTSMEAVITEMGMIARTREIPGKVTPMFMEMIQMNLTRGSKGTRSIKRKTGIEEDGIPRVSQDLDTRPTAAAASYSW